MQHSILAIAFLGSLCSPSWAQFPASVALPGDLNIGSSAGSQEEPSIAFGGNHYLAVWEDGRSALAGVVDQPDGIHPNRDVYATLLDASGALTQSVPLIVDQSPWDQLHTRVAWNGTNYLVVWETTRPTQFFHTQGIHAARVDASGQVLDQPPIVIDDEDDYDERFPEVTSNGNGWLVTWTDSSTATGAGLGGALVDNSGLVLIKRTLVGTASPLPTNYQLAFSGGRFGVIFERNYNSGVAVRFFDNALQQIGNEVSIAAGNRPAIAGNGADFFVAWRAGGILGTPMSAFGALTVPGGASLNSTVGDPRVAVAWDGSQWIAGVTNYGAVYVSQIDAAGVLSAGSPYTLTSGNFYANDAVMANGNGRALLAWSHGVNVSPIVIDPFDIYAAAIVPGGTAVPYPITVSAPAQVYPAIAGDAANGYLIAFQSRSTAQVEILAQRVGINGVPIDTQPLLLYSGASTINGLMDVAFDGAQWLVVWSETMPGGPPYLIKTFARRVRVDGSLPDPAPIDLMRGGGAVVAALNGEFLVATHFHLPPIQSNEIKHYKRVRGADGAVLDASEVLIVGGSGSSDLIAFDDRWLFVWGNVGAVLILGNGAVQTPFVAANSGNGSTGVVHANLARNGDEALLTWEYDASLPWNSDVRSRRIRKDGTLLDTATGASVTSANNAQFLPKATWFGSKYLVSFTDYRDHLDIEPGIGDVYAVRVSSTNQVLDNPALPAQNRWPAAEGRTAIDGANGRALLVSSVLDEAFGTWRLHLQLYSEPGPPVFYCSPKVNSIGCTPAIGSTGTPSTTASSGFVVNCANVRNQKVGILLYSMNGRDSIPFQGGTLCLRTPLRRSVGVNSGGTPQPTADCTGVYQLDMNAFAHGLLGGNPDPALLIPGRIIDAQWWGRDPGFPFPNNSTLSAGIEYGL